VRQTIEAQGCQLLFLPPYSPDLSPIEEAFSRLKAFLRRMGARTPEAFQEAIGQALLTITRQMLLAGLRIVVTSKAQADSTFGKDRNISKSTYMSRNE